MLAFVLTLSILLPTGKGYNCAKCHTNQEFLKSRLKENYKKVWVDPAFLETKMGQLGCLYCHGGQGLPKNAHKGVIIDPSNPPEGKPVCVNCHREITTNFLNSLHFTSAGIKEIFEKRMGKKDVTKAECREIFTGRCGACHATCANCHVAAPKRSGGGLLAAHKFLDKPPAESCKNCHSGIFDKMQGKGGKEPDVHWEKEKMQCLNCHTGKEFHGNGKYYPNSKVYPLSPSCQQCHEEELKKGEFHQIHSQKLSCYVCHAQPVESCYNCHAVEKDGSIKYEVERSFTALKIGKNYMRSSHQPFEYVLMAHVPSSPQTFQDFCNAEAAAFNSLPTWKIARTHNIRTHTFQTADCASCHNNPSLFVTEADLEDYERKANAAVVVDLKEIPRFPNRGMVKVFSKYIIPIFSFLLLLHLIVRILFPYKRRDS